MEWIDHADGKEALRPRAAKRLGTRAKVGMMSIFPIDWML
jgi:hypothetical protein